MTKFNHILFPVVFPPMPQCTPVREVDRTTQEGMAGTRSSSTCPRWKKWPRRISMDFSNRGTDW